MRFEIINPSDPYVMEGRDLEVAAVAVCMLGNGRYSLEGLDEDAGTKVPFFMFGGINDWFTEKFGRAFKDSVAHVADNHAEALAAALDSIALRGAEPSSMNDIGRRAKKLAQLVRERAGRQAAATA